MAMRIEVSILPDAEGDIQVLVSGSGAPPAIGQLAAATVLAASETVRALLRPQPGLVVSGHDAEQVRRERKAGEILGALLFRDDPAGRRLRALQAEARGAERRAALLLDIRVPSLRGLPWELLDDPNGSPLEPAGAAVIIRHLLLPDRPALPPTGSPFLGWRIATWCPDRSDPSCASVLDHLAALAARLGLPAPVPVEEIREGERFVLQLVCHGEGDAQALVLYARDAALHPESVGHALAASLQRAWLVALAVCDAAAPAEAREGLAGLLLAAGASLCIAPQAPLAVNAAQAMAEGLYAALASDQPLCEVVAAARAAIRALGSPEPHGRWTRVLAWVSDARVVERAAIGATPWRPTGFPPCGLDAAEGLRRAAALARDRQDGFVGVEHLLVALSFLNVPASRTLRARLVGRESAVFRHIDLLTPGAPTGDELFVSARLRQVGALLHAGFSAEDLLDALRDAWDAGLTGLLGLDLRPTEGSAGSETTQTVGAPEQGPGEGFPAAALRMIGGPEDGRKIRMAPHQVLGRASARATPDCPLYAEMSRVDATLGRAHLRWLAPGRVWLSRPAMALGRRSDLPPCSGEIALRVGDLLQLSAGTFILGVA